MSNVSLINHDFNGTQIKQRKSDGYLDATAMCKATGKRWFDYYRIDNTQAFINALSGEAGIIASELIQLISLNGVKHFLSHHYLRYNCFVVI